MKRAILITVLVLCAFGLNAQKITNTKAIAANNVKTDEFSLVETEKGFWIQSSMNYGKNIGGCWDIPGHPDRIEKGMNIQVWDIDDGKDRKFYIRPTLETGVYMIIPAGNYESNVLDIAGGEPNMRKNGANIATWTRNSGDWQKFRFKHMGNGEFKIYTTSDMVLCLAARSSNNGSNVHIWEDHDGEWMTWHLVDPETRTHFNPDEMPKTPDFFTENTVSFTQYSMTSQYHGIVQDTKVQGEDITLTVLGHWENHNNNEDQLSTVNLKFRDGFYYSTFETEDGMELEQGRVKTDLDGVVYLHAANGYFRVVEPDFPAFFQKNENVTFKFKESLAFVEGREGTATVKSITDTKVILSVTSTGRNMSNGQMETNTYDFEMNYADGQYSRGSQDSYYEVGTIHKDSEGNEYLRLEGEQSSITLKLQ